MADLKFGSNTIDNMMYGSSQIDKIYLGDTEVWSAIPADVKAHIARVIADGGTVPEQATMVAMVKKLIAANLWDSCVFFGLPLGGVKKDGNEYVSKMYDLKGNADLSQATGTAQPKYDNGALLYDGGDSVISNVLPFGNPIRSATVETSVFMMIKCAPTSVFQHLISRYTTGNLVFIMSNGPESPYFNRFRALIGANSGTTAKIYYCSTDVFDNNWHQIGFTYINNDLKLYLNGHLDTPLKTFDNVSTVLKNDGLELSLGKFNSGDYPLSNGNKTGISLIFNKALTQSEASTLNTIMQAV